MPTPEMFRGQWGILTDDDGGRGGLRAISTSDGSARRIMRDSDVEAVSGWSSDGDPDVSDPTITIPAPFAYYKLDELFDADGSPDDAKDEIGARHWSGNFDELATGKINEGFHCTIGGQTGMLNMAAPNDFDFSGVSWAVRLWLKGPGAGGSFQAILSRKLVNNGWMCYEDAGLFKVDFDNGGFNTVTAGAAVADTWQRILFGWNASTQKAFAQVDNGTINEASQAAPGIASISRLLELTAGDSYPFFDEIAFWKNAIITAAHSTSDWNSGNGRTWVTV